MSDPGPPCDDPRRERGVLRRLRSWARRTPNGEPAMAMIAVGGLLIVAALLLVIFAL